MRKALCILIVLTAVLPFFADEFYNLELVDVWKCPYLREGSIWSSGLALHDGYLYFPGRDYIYILETSDSGHVELVDTVLGNLEDNLGDIVVRDNLAYVSNTYDVLIYDVSDPLVFDSLGSCSIRYSNQIFLMDTLLIAIANKVHLINIADPTNPTYVRGYSLPWADYYLPVVSQENYPYVLMPCRVEYSSTPYDWEALINVIDLTETYSYSPTLLSYSSYLGNKLTSLAKVGDYYIGLTGSPFLTFIEVDTAFGWARSTTTWSDGRYPFPYSSSVINDTTIILSRSNSLLFVSIADTSELSVIASYKHEGHNYEVFYDAIVQDSFLYVFTAIYTGDLRDTLGVYCFKMNMSFSGQCSYYEKPDELTIKTHPNPFNSALRITAPEKATVTIHDTQGRIVADLGTSRLWNAGENVPSGVYIVRAVLGDAVVDGKCVLIR